MEKEVFAPYYKEIDLSTTVIQALYDLYDKKAIDKGLFSAIDKNNIGLCYWYGHIVKKNYEEAVQWYKESAKEKYATAEFNLYVCYERGTGVEKDMKIAIQWLKRAAKHGYANAQFCLAEYYYNGEGMRHNRRFARIWFEKAEKRALEQDDAVMLNLFGIMYLNGDNGFERDIDKAFFIYEKAGMLHFPLSISTLIHHYILRGNKEKVDFWMNEFNNCKTKTKLLAESVEKEYNKFLGDNKHEQ